MSIEELLKPRYKVIADYPDSRFEIGKILVCNSWYDDQDGFWHKSRNSSEEFYGTKYLDKYPNLFKKLEWHEERKESEMPEYVKYKQCVYKHDYKTEIDQLYFNQDCNGHPIGWLKVDSEFSLYTPATEEEYIQYQQNKNI